MTTILLITVILLMTLLAAAIHAMWTAQDQLVQSIAESQEYARLWNVTAAELHESRVVERILQTENQRLREELQLTRR